MKNISKSALRHLVVSFLLGTSVLGGVLVQAQDLDTSGDVDIPDRLASWRSVEGPPYWLSASSATAENGGLRWDLFDSFNRARYQRQLADGSYDELGCFGIERIFTSPIDPPPHETLEDLAAHAQHIVTGVVVARKPGFLAGTPGFLLRLKVLRAFKRSEMFAPQDFVLLFYPKGSFEAGGYRFCVHQPELPPVPSLGDRLLVMPLYPAMDEDRSIALLQFDQYFVERPTGTLEFSRRWESEAARSELWTLDRLESRVQRLLPIQGGPVDRSERP